MNRLNHISKSGIRITQNDSRVSFPFIFSMSDQSRRVLMTRMIVFFFLLAINTLLLAYYIYQPELSTFFSASPANAESIAKMQSLLTTPRKAPMPTPVCESPTLQIGPDTWQIESVKRASDGSIYIPDDTPGISYWIQDTLTTYTFAQSPTRTNLDLFANLQDGQIALLTTQDCDTIQFRLSAPQLGVLGQEKLASLPVSTIIVYIPDSSLAPGQFTQGSLSEVNITSLADAYPAPADPEIGISLLNISTPSDGKHLQVVVSILNNGITPITIYPSDFTLIPTGALPLELIQSYPSLPIRVNPDEVITFNLVFPKPSVPTSTLKIYSQSFNLSGY